MKITSTIKTITKIAIAILLLFGLALILPEPTIITKDPLVQSTYTKTTNFLTNQLGFETTSKEGILLGSYSLLIAISVWGYYHLILFLRLLTIGNLKKLRSKEEEGLPSRLLSLSKYRIINMIFGNIYKVIAFMIFTVIIYNIPIINRLIYIYMLEFLKTNFFIDALIMVILIIILPRLIESFLTERRKNKMEKGLMTTEKIKALVSSADKVSANI